MAKERDTYRANLEELHKQFPGRETITMPEAARYLGVSLDRLNRDKTFPHRRIGDREQIILVNLALWLSA